MFFVVLGASTTAHAFDKGTCVDSHASAQKSMKAGRLLESKEQLLVCADSSCPSLVREDCEKWLSNLDRSAPPATIEARKTTPASEPNSATDPSSRATGERVERDGRTTTEAVDPPSDSPQGNGAPAVEAPKAQLPSPPPVNAQAAHDQPSPGDDLVPVRAAPPRHSVPKAAWITGALALASFGTAAVLGVTGVMNAQSLRDTCAPNCQSSRVSAVRQDLLIADLSALTGVAFGAVTAWMVWTHSEADAHDGRTPEAARFSASITGRSFRLDYAASF